MSWCPIVKGSNDPGNTAIFFIGLFELPVGFQYVFRLQMFEAMRIDLVGVGIDQTEILKIVFAPIFRDPTLVGRSEQADLNVTWIVIQLAYHNRDIFQDVLISWDLKDIEDT